jgi:uncharacterized coiled-coil DUF342 family protein
MSDDQFTKLFKYVGKRFDEMNVRFDDARLDRIELKGGVAELGAQIRDYHHEMLMFSRQFDRLKEAIMQIAKETGVELKVEL